jgi:hypothetical protein
LNVFIEQYTYKDTHFPSEKRQKTQQLHVFLLPLTPNNNGSQTDSYYQQNNADDAAAFSAMLKKENEKEKENENENENESTNPISSVSE